MDGEEAENETPAVSESGRRRPVSIPNDMTTELATLNDQDLSDDEMMFHVRQFVATFAKRIKETT